MSFYRNSRNTQKSNFREIGKIYLGFWWFNLLEILAVSTWTHCKTLYKATFLLKINISVQKRGVYFLWQNPKRKGSTMEFHTFCKSVLWSCSDPKTFLAKCSSKKVSMMPSKGQVSNPSRLREAELSVYFLRLTTVVYPEGLSCKEHTK